MLKKAIESDRGDGSEERHYIRRGLCSSVASQRRVWAISS